MSDDYFDCQLTKPFNLSRIAALATEARQTAAFDPLRVGQRSEEALTAIRNSGEQEMLSKLDPKLFRTVEDGQQQRAQRLKRAEKSFTLPFFALKLGLGRTAGVTILSIREIRGMVPSRVYTNAST